MCHLPAPLVFSNPKGIQFELVATVESAHYILIIVEVPSANVILPSYVSSLVQKWSVNK